MYLSGPCHRAFTAKLEEKKKSTPALQRKTPLSPVFGQVIVSSYRQPGTPGAEESTVTALVPVRSILLLHSTECHHDHKDHDELATLERQLAHMNDSGVLLGTTNWNGCFASVHLAMTGMVYLVRIVP